MNIGRKVALLGALLATWASALAETLENERYALRLETDGSLILSSRGAPSQTIEPVFVVFFSPGDPGYGANHGNYLLAPRTSALWRRFREPLASLNERLRSPDYRDSLPGDVAVAEDAQGRRTWLYRDGRGKQLLKVSGAYGEGTVDPWFAGEKTILRGGAAAVEGRTVRWSFPTRPDFDLEAELSLPEGVGAPRLVQRLKAKRQGCYSAAFAGSPKLAVEAMLRIPQECSGRERRQFNHLVTEAYLRLPRVQLAAEGWNFALVVDPEEMPFRIATRENARFGLCLRREGGVFQPLSFAPILGGAESFLKPGQSRSFAVRLVLQAGDWKETYRTIAREDYGFRDLRDNSGPGPLNDTLARTMDFLADRNGENRALWHAEQKYYDYWTDNSGIFKPFSPLYGLSAAIVTDDEAFYLTRALPQVEFALSRTNNTFAPYAVAQNGQVKARNRGLGHSYLPAAQLATLAAFYQGRVPALASEALERGFSEKSFVDQLALWQLIGAPEALARAKIQGLEALGKKAGEDEDAYMDWLELYLATGERRFLEAALDDAYALTTSINLSPVVPDTLVEVESGGKVPVHEHSFGRHKLWGFPPPRPLDGVERKVPAWRVALTGLQSPAYRGELWMNNHGQLLRLAALGRDDFLRDIARWGMVGRFANYSGDNRSSYSLIMERSDAVERPVWEWNFATVNPGHAWEFAGEILDYLVSDAFQRSEGAVDFPGRPMPGTAFRVRVYGDRPGRFYGDEGVRLWLPRQLLRIDNRQIDYVAGYGPRGLYLAFLNQSFSEENVLVSFDGKLVDLGAVRGLRTWRENRPETAAAVLSEGKLRLRISAKGIVAVALDGARAKPGLQARLFSPDAKPLGPHSFASAKASFGEVHAQLLSAGSGLVTGYVYSDALPENTVRAFLRYRQGDGPWNEKTDLIFPYEFTNVLENEHLPIEYAFGVENADGRRELAPEIILRP